ncbi:MAG: 5'-deoxynucleotidase [Oscillospiraceae bacterium]|nr:5'-deoxynucleotidase [Candidatus Equicaccousia limihippi]
MSNFYSVIHRMKYIDRWALMRNLRKENLSVHTLDVAYITHALCVIENKRLNNPVNTEKAVLCALYHDTPEVITGDMPTPVKYYDKEISSAYKKIEETAKDKLISLLPDDFSEDFELLFNPDEPTAKIVKAADKLSAYIKCIEETENGNKDFKDALISTEKAIDGMKMPCVEIFKKEFIPAFKFTLDKQTK